MSSRYKEYKVVVSSIVTAWYKPGTETLHREDGPAQEFSDGRKIWYQNGLVHRDDGAALIYVNGGKEWYIHGKRHRVDGPAVDTFSASGHVQRWFIQGDEYTEEQFKKHMEKVNDPCDGKLVEIDGKKYKLTAI